MAQNVHPRKKRGPYRAYSVDESVSVPPTTKYRRRLKETYNPPLSLTVTHDRDNVDECTSLPGPSRGQPQTLVDGTDSEAGDGDLEKLDVVSASGENSDDDDYVDECDSVSDTVSVYSNSARGDTASVCLLDSDCDVETMTVNAVTDHPACEGEGSQKDVPDSHSGVEEASEWAELCEVQDMLKESDVEKKETGDWSRELLYEHSRLDVATSTLLIESFTMRHNLSTLALSHLLRLIELHCPAANRCTTSVGQFRKVFDAKNDSTIKKCYYCSFCGLQGKSSLENNICESCRHVVAEDDYFLTVPIENQLQQILSGNFQSIIIYSTTLTVQCR